MQGRENGSSDISHTDLCLKKGRQDAQEAVLRSVKIIQTEIEGDLIFLSEFCK